MDKAKYIYGNWKMNGLMEHKDIAVEIDVGVKNIKADSNNTNNVEVGLFPPFTLIKTVADEVSSIIVGAQDCHFVANGAHTGDVSADMIKELGGSAVILGHSERRSNHHETSQEVAKKAQYAQSVGLQTVICVGESLEERESGNAEAIVIQQLKDSVPSSLASDNVIIAYEPVWAIGTGKIPQIEDIRDMHNSIRKELVDIFGSNGNEIAIQYGGSVNANNAAQILAVENVGGALVGGASLKPTDFLAIVKAAAEIK